MDRRQFGGCVTAIVSTAMAGCLGDSAVETPTTTADRSAAEDIVEQYIEAMLTGDEATIAELEHDTLDSGWRAFDATEYEIVQVEQIPIPEAAANTGLTAEELERMGDSTGADRHTFVSVEYELSTGDTVTQQDGIVYVIETNGRWVVRELLPVGRGSQATYEAD